MAKGDKKVVIHEKAPAGWLAFTAYIGAAIHFVSRSEGFGEFILALLKAAVWPAYLLNKILEILRI